MLRFEQPYQQGHQQKRESLAVSPFFLRSFLPSCFNFPFLSSLVPSTCVIHSFLPTSVSFLDLHIAEVKPKSVPHANFTDEQRAKVIRHYERVRNAVKEKGLVSHGSSLLLQRLCFSLTFTSLADYIDQAIMNAICSPTSEPLGTIR